MTQEKHDRMEDLSKCIPVPDDTQAFMCARCGAVSLDVDRLCQPLGKGCRRDWCGTPSLKPPESCQNFPNNLRYICGKCRKVAVNPELLCDPQPYPEPEQKEGAS
ncbi:hypothetical protein [Desulfuromonas acetoxidans]|uniref:Uncharacterized protein n=1 Tax=Desulfuromonas acetoxidans (strain DSM 684 / 11070) TaxID=281689 RepID=Q1JX15_DESA6|nr:hypothetical protein [Desulfuromonas acetoxidans]EAT14743.1 hypothetical protein Dace_0795 [Desulfuromonas acetoxidans DSM 684]